MNFFKEIIVSSDSNKILKLASKKIPIIQIKRPKNLSSDYAGTREVVVHAINKLKNQNIKNVFCIYPTSIFLKKKHIILAKKKLNSKTSYVFTASKVNKSFFRSFYIDQKKQMKMFKAKYYNYRTQDLEQLFFDIGQLYLAKQETWINNKKIFDKKSKFIEIDKNNAYDIDYPSDWKFAELLYLNNEK